jgi:hypothetical protein
MENKELLYALDLLFDIKTIQEAVIKLESLENDVFTLKTLLTNAGVLEKTLDT